MNATAPDLRTVAAFKRAMTPGAVVVVENLNVPALSGPRTVGRCTTRDFSLLLPDGHPNASEPSYAAWPKRADYSADGSTVTLSVDDRPFLRITFPAVTSAPRWPADDADNPDRDEYVFVGDVKVGGTYRCSDDTWTSYGAAGHSTGHATRADAQAVQVTAYLADPDGYRARVIEHEAISAPTPDAPTFAVGAHVVLADGAHERFGIEPGHRGTVVRTDGDAGPGAVVDVHWDGVPAARDDMTAVADLVIVGEEVSAPSAPAHPLAGLFDRIAEWNERAEAFLAERGARHPDVTDRHGRVWTWKSGDLYTHDDTLAFPRDMIDGLSLPPAALSENLNYAGLCETCRSHWTPEQSARVVALAGAYGKYETATDPGEREAALQAYFTLKGSRTAAAGVA